MRRAVVSLWSIMLVLALTPIDAAAAVRRDATPAAEALSGPEPCPNGIMGCTLDTLISVPDDPNSDVYVQVFRLEFAGDSDDVNLPHMGQSTLYVESGVACFFIDEPDASTASVTVHRGSGGAGVAAPVDPTPDPRCTDYEVCATGCDLGGREPILLQPGDSVTQFDDSGTPADDSVVRYYGNAGPDPLVILTANLQPDAGDMAPCNGGCM